MIATFVASIIRASLITTIIMFLFLLLLLVLPALSVLLVLLLLSVQFVLFLQFDIRGVVIKSLFWVFVSDDF